MSDEHKATLTKHRVDLIKNLNLDTLLLDHLQSEEAITNEEAMVILSKVVAERNGELLDVLSRKADCVFFKFIDALNETSQRHLSHLLQPPGLYKNIVRVSEGVGTFLSSINNESNIKFRNLLHIFFT